ncbi:S-adenosyl-L-methionine-dependent methyltransferase [Crucibulum laeve]|uniref:S-adenosyl-L-methionine-dependent methyltransferase n=1 Tax=Crucibulum laeve TaxID=68775 RepID=A0A5C3LLX4_9AGAR|nr:S-adenosyl-L-methionine-dependent methyltransferase [Crucibulum laeve]
MTDKITANVPEKSESEGASTAEDLKTIVESGYDAIAPTYLAWSAPRPTTTRIAYLTKLITLLPLGASVLELGCGAGVPSTQLLTQHDLKVTGVDISAAQIALAREHVPKATLIHVDMMKLTFEPESFNAVVAFYSIFHLPREEQGEMVKQIVGWLKPGGILLFNLGTEEGDQIRDDWMGTKMFSTGLGLEGNREMLKKSAVGLDVEDEVAAEKVGSMEVMFHWVWAVKKIGDGEDGQQKNS